MEAHGGALSRGLGPRTIDFSVSVNPLGAHPAVIERVRAEAATAIRTYPDAAAGRLEGALATYAGAPHDMVVAGNGATEIIHNVCRDAAGSDVLVAGPAFGEYAAAAGLCGSRVQTVCADNMEDVVGAVPRNGLVFAANPSNPLGTLTPKRGVLELVRACRDANATAVIDECFIEMTPDRDESVTAYTMKYGNMVVLRSMTKSFGLAGLRLGYAVSGISERLRRLRAPWSVNGLAQIAGIEALQHTEHLRAALRVIREEVAFVRERIPGARRTDANYMVVRAPTGAREMQERLLKRGILVRDCSSFGMPEHIRIGVRTRRENTILADAVADMCRT